MIEIGDLANLYNVESGDKMVNGVLDMHHANGYSGYGEMLPHSYSYNLSTTVQEGETPCKIIDNRDKSETSVDVQRQNDVEQQKSQYKRNISAHTASQPNYLINGNGDVLDMKHANGYSGYSEAFSQSHSFNTYNFKTVVQEGETSCKIIDNGDKSKTSVDVQTQNDVEQQEPWHNHNISAPTASQSNDYRLSEKIYATEKRHKCDLCDYCSKTSGALKMHKLIHSGERPYKCDLCDYSTTQAGDLKKHKLIHSGVKPYKCDVCDYRASQKGTLKKHKLIHTGERPYECDLCDYSTTESGNLTRHKLKHTGVKPYKCDLCDYSTKLKGHLKA